MTQTLYQLDRSKFATMHGHSNLVNYFVPMAGGMVGMFNPSGVQFVRHAALAIRARRALDFLSGGRTVLSSRLVLSFRIGTGGVIAGLYYLWKLRQSP